MRNILIVGIGGFLGSVLRFIISDHLNKIYFPLGTLSVNLLGSFLLGFVFGYSPAITWILLLGVGVLGGFTTFSTLTWEIFLIYQEMAWLKLFSYVAITIILGVIMAFVGYICGANFKN